MINIVCLDFLAVFGSILGIGALQSRENTEKVRVYAGIRDSHWSFDHKL